MPASQTPLAGRQWSGNLWLLVLVGLTAVVGGYWLPSRLSSGETKLASSEWGTTRARHQAGPSASETDSRTKETGQVSRLPTPLQTPSPWPAELYAPLGRLALATAIVLGLILIFVIVARRYWTGRLTEKNGSSVLELAAELSLPGRCRLLLVRVGKEQVLLGVDSRGISGLIALPTRFADWLEETNSLAESNPQLRRSAIAAMVGEEER